MSTFKFTCAYCGEVHEDAPSIGYNAPYYYDCLSAQQKQSIATLNDDFCVIDDQDHFIRVILEVPINECHEPFLWGVWVSVKRENYWKYHEAFHDDSYRDRYFGWFSNKLPYYPDTLGIKTYAHIVPGGKRPRLELEPTEHPLAVDFRDGVAWERAIDIAALALHGPHS